MNSASRNPTRGHAVAKVPARRLSAAKAPRPLNNYNFRVLIGKAELGFCQISQLESGYAAPLSEAVNETSPRAGAGGAVPARLVVLKRALTRSKDLYQWWSNANRGRKDLRHLTVQQLDVDGDTILNTWVLHGCLPRRWTGPEFNALAEGIAFEEVELSYEKLVWT